jgi:hypothetical protein
MNEKFNELYSYLKGNGMTDLDANSFYKKYSDPVKSKEIYSYLKSNKMTDLDETSFYSSYFGGKKKEPTASVSPSGQKPTSSVTPAKKAQPQSVFLQDADTGGKLEILTGYPQKEDIEYNFSNGQWRKRKPGQTSWYNITNEGSISSLNKFFAKEKIPDNKKSVDQQVRDLEDLRELSDQETADALGWSLEDLQKANKGTKVNKVKTTGATVAPNIIEGKDAISVQANSIAKARIELGSSANQEKINDRAKYHENINLQKYLKNKGFDVDINGDIESDKTKSALDKLKAIEELNEIEDLNRSKFISKVNSDITSDMLSSPESIDQLRSEFSKNGYVFESFGGSVAGLGVGSGRYIKVKYTLGNGEETREEVFDTSDPEASRNMRLFMSQTFMSKSEKEAIIGDDIPTDEMGRFEYMSSLVGKMAANPSKYGRTLVSDEWISNHMKNTYRYLKDEQTGISLEYDNLKKRIDQFKLNPTEEERQLINNKVHEISVREIKLNGQYEKAKETEKNFSSISAAYATEMEKKGGFFTGLTAQFAKGVTSIPKMMLNISADILPYVVDAVDPITKSRLKDEGYSDSEIADYASKQLKNTVVKDIEKGVVNIGSLGQTTEEYLQSEDRGVLENTLGFLANSIGTGLSGGGNGALTKLAFFSQSYNGMSDQMTGPEFDRLTETEKKLISVPYALVIGGLERLGFKFTTSTSKNPLLNKLINNTIAKTFSGIPKDASIQTINRAISESLTATMAQAGLRVVGGSIVEGAVEGSQQLAEISIKNIANGIIGEDEDGFDFFKDVPDITTAEGIKEALKLASVDAAYGALGGAIMSTGENAVSSIKNYGIKKEQEKDFLTLRATLLDGNLRALQDLDIERKLSYGEITQEEADEMINSMNNATSALGKIPDGLSTSRARESFGLLIERDKLEQEVKGKDENLVVVQKERIKEINNELQTISKDAVQEQAAGEVSVQPEATTSEEVVQGKPESGPEVVTEEGKKEEIDAKQAEVDSFQAEANKKYEELKEKGFPNNEIWDNPEYRSIRDRQDAAQTELDALQQPTETAPVTEVFEFNGKKYELTNESVTDLETGNLVPIELATQIREEGTVSTETQQEQVATLRAQEQVDLAEAIPNIDEYKVDGKVDKSTMPADVLAKYEEIYDRYDKLITPLLTTAQPITSKNQVTLDNFQELENQAVQEGNDTKIKTLRAARMVVKSLPGVKVFVHNSPEEYQQALADASGDSIDTIKSEEASERSSGQYVNGEIHVDGSIATERTVYHEAFHDAILKSGLSVEMAKGLLKIISDKKIKSQLEAFISQYESSEQNEEMVVELGAIMAEAGTELSTTKLQQFKQLINKLAQKLGLPVMLPASADRQQVVDFINTMSKAIRTGRAVDMKTKIDTANVSTKKRKIGAFDVQYFEDSEQFQKLVDEGLVENNFDLGTISGEVVAIHQPDNMFVGTIKHKGEEIFTGNGGVFYTPNTGNVWASGAETSAKSLSNLINKSLEESTDGVGRLVLVRGTDSKMISSTEGVKAAMSIVELLVDKGLISRAEFRSSLIRAGKKFNIDFSGKDSSTAIHKDIKDKFMDVKNSTFQRRGDFFDEVINDLASTSKTAKENIEDIRSELGSKRKISFSKDGIRDSIGEILTERLLSGLPTSHAYAVIEVTSPVTYKERKGHDSYPWILVSDSKPVLKLLSNREHAVKGGIFEMIDGSDVSQAKLGLAQRGMGIAKIAESKESKSTGRKKRMTEPVAGNKLFNEPLKDASKIANDYAKKSGIDFTEPERVTKLDEENSKAIAAEYDKMKNNPTDPEVKKAYDAMISETISQYEEIIGNGYVVEVNNNEPYSSSGDMISDLKDNKRMKIFSTESGFGDDPITDQQREDNPLLQKTKFKDVNGVPLLANDLFRFVHDFFGHAKFGNGFGPVGEENAWVIHSAMYSDPARRAMTSETRGQNSWVNFSGANDAVFKLRDKARVLRQEGKINEANELIGQVYDQMQFADQKVGLMPEWVSETGAYSRKKQKSGGKKVTAQKVNQSFKNPVKKVIVNDRTALRNQLRLEARAARESQMDLKQKQRALIVAINKMKRGGLITVNQASILAKRLAFVNVDNPIMIERFLGYAEKLFADAEYSTKLNSAFEIQKKIKRAIKSDKLQASVVATAKAFSKLNPSLVEDIDTYIENAEKVMNAVKSSRANVKDGVDLDNIIKGKKADIAIELKTAMDFNEIGEYTDKAIELENEYRKNELMSIYKDLSDANIITKEMSIEEMKEVITSVMNESKDKMPAEEKLAYIMSWLGSTANVYRPIIKSMLNGRDPFTGDDVVLSEKQDQIIRNFLKIDVTKMDVREAMFVVEAMDNFITNKITDGLETVIAKYEGKLEAEKLSNSGFKTRSMNTFGNEKSKLGTGRLWAQEMMSLKTLTDLVFRGVNNAQKITKAMGLSAYENGVALANRLWNNSIDSYYNEFKKTKPNGEKFMSAKNIYERGMYAALKRTIPGDQKIQDAELKRKIKLINDSISTLMKGSERDQEIGKMYSEVAEKLGINESVVTMLDIESRVDSNNMKAVDWWVSKWADNYSELADVSQNVYNTILDRDMYYTPDKFSSTKPVEKSVEEVFESGGAFGQFLDYEYDKKSGVLMPSAKQSSMAEGRFLDLNFDMNNSKSLKAALVDMKTATSIRKISGFLKSKDWEKVMTAQEDRDVFRKKIDNYILRSRNKSTGAIDNDYAQALDKAGKIWASMGAARALGGFTQPLKQTIPILFSTIINSGRVDFAIGKDQNDWIGKIGRGISNRGLESQSGFEDANRMIDDAVNSGNAVKVLAAIERTNRNILKLVLAKPDVFIARSSFISYYKQYMANNGMSEDINYAKPEDANQDALDYAQRMIDRQQNISDGDLAGELMASNNPYKKLTRNILLPFASFAINQKSRMFTDFSTLMGKEVSNQDRVLAARSLAGLAAEIAVFNAIAIGIKAGVIALAGKIIPPAPEDEKEKEEQLWKQWGYIIGNVIASVISPVPLTDSSVISASDWIYKQANKISKSSSGETKEALKKHNEERELNGERALVGKEADRWMENHQEENRFKIRGYTNDNMAGTYTITYNKLVELKESYDLAFNGEYEQDVFGKVQKKYILKEDRDILRYMFIGNAITNIVGFPSEFSSVNRRIENNIKKKSAISEKKFDTYNDVVSHKGGDLNKAELFLVKNMDGTKSQSGTERVIEEIEWIKNNGGFDNERQMDKYIEIYQKEKSVNSSDMYEIKKIK